MWIHSFNRFISRFFPVPHFFSTSTFGLDISDESVKFLELVNSKDGPRIGRHGEKIIPAGIIESGRIKDPKKMEEILLLLKQQEGVKSVRASLLEEQVYLYTLKLEKQDLVNVRESIELSLEEHIPIQAENAIFDYEIINENTHDLEIQVAAIPKNVIEGYLEIFKNSGITVESFELEPQAISRAVIKKGDRGTYMIVDFGEKRTGIFIISSGVVRFTSTLDVGGATLTDMIVKNFKVTPAEADKMKKEYGLRRNTDHKEIFSVLLNSVSILRDELVKHFVYWHTHKDEEGNQNPPISKIILCGGDSNLIGLSEYLSVSMKTKVEVANVWVNIMNTAEQVPDINFKQALSFAATFGLALRDFESS